jgi:hypothetical protein
MSQVYPSPKSSPTDSSSWSLAVVGVALCLCWSFLYISHRPLSHADIWGHLKFGQWICTHHQLPYTDPFLPETDKTTPIWHFSWLAQIAFYQVFRFGEFLAGPGAAEAGGVEALRTLHAVLLVLRMLFLYFAFRRVSGSATVALLGLVAVLVLGLPNMDVLRPQIWAEICFALLLWALSFPQLSNTSIFGLALLLAIWANLHGSFMIGLLVMGGANGGQFLQGCREAGGIKLLAVWRYEPFRRLFLCIMLSLLAMGSLNPAGFGIYGRALSFFHHPAVAMMEEWRPIAWDTPYGLSFLASLVYVTLTFLAGGFWLPKEAPKRMLICGVPLGQVLLLIFFGWRTVGCQRFILWWVFLMVWVSMNVWGPLWRYWIKEGLGDWSLRPSFVSLLLVGMIVPTVMFSGAGHWLSERRLHPLACSLDSATPWALVQQIHDPASNAFPALTHWFKTQNSAYFSGRIFTTETLGDYLLWSLPPEHAPLLFSHVHLFSADYWFTCLQIRRGEGDWEAALERMGATLLMVEAELHPELRRQLLSSEHQKHWYILVDETGDTKKCNRRARWLIAVRKK